MMHFSLRLPDTLHARIKAAAEHERRSIHSEILSLIERGLGGENITETSPVAVRTQHQARPGRRAIVIIDLTDLRGPATGKFILPLRLYWSTEGRIFNLDDPWMRQELYRIVLTEAVRGDELVNWINGPTLIETWKDLRDWLPRGVRQAWEELHPALTATESVKAA